MKVLRTIGAIFEKAAPSLDNPPDFTPKPSSDVVVKAKSKPGSGQNSSPAAKPTDAKKEELNCPEPDPAIMDKLLKIPNSTANNVEWSLWYPSRGESKPDASNAVGIWDPKVGRFYIFRSKPLEVSAYEWNGPGIPKSEQLTKLSHKGTYIINDIEKVLEITAKLAGKTLDGKTGIEVKEQMSLSSGKIIKSNILSSRSTDAATKSVISNVAGVIRENLKRWDSDQDAVYKAIEAALWYAISNNLAKDGAKKFFAEAFKKEGADASTMMQSLEDNSLSDIFYLFESSPGAAVIEVIGNWSIQWAPEDDAQTSFFSGIVHNNELPFQYEPAYEDAQAWADTLWEMIGDSYVGKDEEVNSMLAIVSLSPKGFANVNAAWEELKTLGRISTKQSLYSYFQDEIDSRPAKELIARIINVLRNNPSPEAKAFLQAS